MWKLVHHLYFHVKSLHLKTNKQTKHNQKKCIYTAISVLQLFSQHVSLDKVGAVPHTSILYMPAILSLLENVGDF